MNRVLFIFMHIHSVWKIGMRNEDYGIKHGKGDDVSKLPLAGGSSTAEET